jgi:integrase
LGGFSFDLSIIHKRSEVMGVTATVVIRVTDEATRKRRWVPATGRKSDPVGSYYLRYCRGSSPRYQYAGDRYEIALVEKIKLERRLKAASVGAVIVEDVTTPKTTDHRIDTAIEAYLADLTESRRPSKTINSKRTELQAFAKFCGKTHMEQLTRVVLMAYRNSLLDQGYARVTVLNKLMTVVTWLKKNPVHPVSGLLKKDDFPEKPDTEPNPYSDAELRALMAAATPEERLLLRFFHATGMREQEVAHAERSDIGMTYIQVEEKPEYNWKPKTKAGTRKIPLSASLRDDLLASSSDGLLFPNETTGRPEGHFLRIIQDIAERAGVKGAGCHRFRDTYATEQVRARVLDLRDIARNMGHNDLETMKLYAAFCDRESQQWRKAAKVSDRFGDAGPRLVKGKGATNAA